MTRRKNKGRLVNGILLLDKPVGITSNKALQAVKFVYRAQKAGHTGSLDPLASGLLPICFGEATKISAFLLDADKRYQVEMRLGQKTDTGDSDGKIIEEKPVPDISSALLESVLDQHRGEISQIPPMYSALRHEGKRLYKLAREGVEVERKPRAVSIYKLKLLEKGQQSLRLDVHCSKGTYVRTLVEDIGAALGCGAHVTALRRLSVGPYQNCEMITLKTIEEFKGEAYSTMDERLLPLDSALPQWPEIKLNADLTYYVRQGQPVFVPNTKDSGMVRLYDDKSIFMGVGQVQPDGKIAPKRLFQNI